ncbi:transmembrane protein 87A [Pyrus ussuriensis x Pyrus communis]|uniref:Transmembrane protein 87A n=1 Tax=Pyrus ussuriensis x Pyrus communis TaxID=2448454 RepID=A0A5N5G5I6_9ROSA|nr:transmembrane protein 87A [Pyrus ussuriensis x Pyrus communis]
MDDDFAAFDGESLCNLLVERGFRAQNAEQKSEKGVPPTLPPLPPSSTTISASIIPTSQPSFS